MCFFSKLWNFQMEFQYKLITISFYIKNKKETATNINRYTSRDPRDLLFLDWNNNSFIEDVNLLSALFHMGNLFICSVLMRL